VKDYTYGREIYAPRFTPKDRKEPCTMLTMTQCCEAILQSAHEKALAYAVGYARHGLTCEGPEARVQALYILGNITHWRGPMAKQVRASLKSLAKGN